MECSILCVPGNLQAVVTAIRRERKSIMERTEILETARKCVCGDREQDYGSPEKNFEKIAKFWEEYVREKCVSPGSDVCFMPHDVAAMLILLKVARVASGNAKDDNWVDIAGYAACGGELEGRAGQ